MKLSLNLLLFPLILCPFAMNAQTAVWEKNYGGSNEDRGYDIIATSDGNYVMAGWAKSSNNDISSSNGGADYWVVKINPSGSIIWEHTYGGSNEDYAYTIRETKDKGFIVVGNTASAGGSGDVGGNNGLYDTWLVKLDSKGVLQWEQNYGGTDYDFGFYVEQTSDGGYIFTSNSASSDGDVGGNYGLRDIWIVKTDATGKIQWEQNYGGSDYDYPCAIKELPGGNFIVSGRTKSTDHDVSSTYGDYDVWVFKIDKNGTILWEKNYGGTMGELTNGMDLTSDYKIILGGRSYSSNNDVPANYGNGDAWVAKMDTNGVLNWFKNYGGSSFDEVQCIKEAADGKYIFMGTSTSSDQDVSANYGDMDYWVVKLTTSGNIQWEKNYGGTLKDEGFALVPSNDGKDLVLGRSESTDKDITNNYGSFDYWLVGVDDTLINVSTGPTERLLENITVYPNPSNGQFTLSYDEQHIQNIQIMDISGRSIPFLVTHLKRNISQISLNNAKPGIYILRAKNKQQTICRKFIIEKN